MKNVLSRLLAVVGALTAYCIGLPLHAQQLEEIVVTARQREEALIDVPATITAFTRGEVTRAGIERAEDFIALTPGVSLVDTAEAGDTQVSIRGINGSRDAETNFAFIVDGILYTNPSAFNREFADLEQIEVLKGPQGAIYGRSAASGAVIVTTRRPGPEYEAAIKSSVGNNNSYYVSAHAGGGLSDGLAGRIHFDYRSTDGFYENTNNSAGIGENTVDDFENYNINGRLLWEPNDRLSLDLRARYGEVDAASISFNAAFALADAAAALGVGALNEDVNEHNFVFQPNIRSDNDQQAFDISIKADYDMDWATLTGWLLYSDIEQSLLADGTSGSFGFFNTDPNCIASVAATAATDPLPAPQYNVGVPQDSFFGPYTPTTCDGVQLQERNQDDISVELRLTSPDEQRLRWLFGGYYLELEREVGVATVRDPGIGFIPGATLQRALVGPDTEALVYDRFDTTVLALFGQLAYDVSDTFEIAAALRYDNEERDVTSLVPAPGEQTSKFIDFTDTFMAYPLGLFPCPGLGDGAGSPLNPAFVDFTNCTINQSIPDRGETYEELQPKLSLRYSVNDNLTLFGSWGVGFKSGGFNNQGSQATIDLFFNTPLLDPTTVGGAGAGAGLSISDEFAKETSSAFEIGFKSAWADDRLRMEGSLYHTRVDNMQVFNFFVGPFGLLRVVSNIDEVEITGGEYNLSVQVTEALRVFGGMGLIDTHIDKNSNRPQTVGNKVPYAPDWTMNLGAEWIKPTGLPGNLDFVGRFDYSAVGPTWFSEVQEGDRTPNLYTPFGFGYSDQSNSQRESFALINVRAGLQGDAWGLHAIVKNLTDTNYLAEVIPAPEFGGSFIHPGHERAWAVELSYQY